MHTANTRLRGTVMKAASPIRQSRTNTRMILKTGPARLEGSSGTMWAMMSSSRPTLSTIKVLKVPEGVSSMTPMGTFAIFSARAHRMFFRMVKETVWLRMEDRPVSHARRHMHTAAVTAMTAARSTVAVPS